MELQFNHYALADPRVDDPVLQVRYIGRTTRSFRLRWKGHVKSVRDGGRTHRDHWLRELFERGLEPVVIDLGKGGEARESELIAHWRNRGADLTNRTDGGEGCRGLDWTPEMRAEKSRLMKEMSADPEWREKVRKASLAVLLTPEVQQKVREGVRRHYEEPGAHERKQEQQREMASRPEVRAKFYSPENRQKRIEGRKKWLEDPANHANLCRWSREFHARPEVKAEASRRMRELHARPDVKAASSQRASEMNARPENRERNAERFRAMNREPEQRAANIQRCHEMNADPEIAARRVAAFSATYRARRAADPVNAEIVRMAKEGLSKADMARKLGMLHVTLSARIVKLQEDGLL